MREDESSSDSRPFLERGIRPSRTRSTVALWSKSLLNALVFFAVFMLAMPALAHWLLPARVPLVEGFRAGASALLGLIGVAVWIWGLDAFSRQGRGTPFPLDAPRELATRGPFARIRNPIMAAEIAVIWAVALYLGSLGAMIYAIGISALAHVLVIRIEEPELRRRFGATYDAYCDRVPRWIPRISPASTS